MQNFRLVTLEGSLLRQWRRDTGVSQSELGGACLSPELTARRVSDCENLKSSLRVATLLNLVRGLEAAAKISLGRDDAERLSQFFLGPKHHDALRRKRNAERDLRALDARRGRS